MRAARWAWVGILVLLLAGCGKRNEEARTAGVRVGLVFDLGGGSTDAAAALGVHRKTLVDRLATAIFFLGGFLAQGARLFLAGTKEDRRIEALVEPTPGEASADAGERGTSGVAVAGGQVSFLEHGIFQDLVAPVLYARLLHHLGELDEAIERLTAFVEKHPEHGEAGRLRGVGQQVGLTLFYLRDD